MTVDQLISRCEHPAAGGWWNLPKKIAWKQNANIKNVQTETRDYAYLIWCHEGYSVGKKQKHYYY